MKRACVGAAILLLVMVAVGSQTGHLERAVAQSKPGVAKKAPAKRSLGKGAITIDSCHIMLIDHVELGVERGGILSYVEPHVGDLVQGVGEDHDADAALLLREGDVLRGARLDGEGDAACEDAHLAGHAFRGVDSDPVVLTRDCKERRLRFERSARDSGSTCHHPTIEL